MAGIYDVLKVLKLCIYLIICGSVVCDSCFIITENPDVIKTVQDLSDSTNIVEFDFEITNYSDAFWNNVSLPDWYMPLRQYRCKTKVTERFLLLFRYYYGLFKSYAYVGLTQLKVKVKTDPPECLVTKTGGEIQELFNSFILGGLVDTNGSNDVPVSETSVCSMRIIDSSGWAYFGYRCCRKSSAGELDCYNVTDNVWSWILRALILTATVFLFLYFPLLIPKSYREEVFSFFPTRPQIVNVMTTRGSTKTEASPATVVVPFSICQNFETFSKIVSKLPLNVVKSIEVKKFDFRIKFDRIVAENEPPFGLFRAFYDSFIRCQIRHHSSLEECCNSQICGQYSCKLCPRWYLIVREIRTIMLFAILALPSIPLLYHLCYPPEEYREVAERILQLGLKQTSSFYVHTSVSIAIVSVLAACYIVHVIVVVVDGIRDRNLGKLYSQLLSSQNARSTFTSSKKKVRSVIRNALLPVRKLGILFLPIWLLFVAISPGFIFLYFIITSPVFRICLRIFRLIIGNFENTKWGREELKNRCENLMFCLTIISMFVVLSIGFNFLLHVLTMIIVNMIVNILFTMRILPVVILIVFYIRDTFSAVSTTYHGFSKTLLANVVAEKSEECNQVAKLPLEKQENIIFQTGTPKPTNGTGEHIFKLDYDDLSMKTKGLTLFLHNEDIAYLSKEFFHQATYIVCHGSPGPISESLRAAIMEFARIILFLVCLLIVVMAYGDISYISPEGQFFVTFVTGLIPFALKKFVLNQDGGSSLDTGNLRFTTQLQDLKDRFQQELRLEDIHPLTDEERDKPSVECSNGEGGSTSTWSINAAIATKQTTEQPVVDLVVDMSDFELTPEICTQNGDVRELDDLESGKNKSCLKPVSVSP